MAQANLDQSLADRTALQSRIAELQKTNTANAGSQSAAVRQLRAALDAAEKRFEDLDAQYDRTVKTRTAEALELKRENERLVGQIADLNAAQPSSTAAVNVPITRDQDGRILGAQFAPLDDDLSTKFGHSPAVSYGIVIVGLSNNSPLYRSGMRGGDLIRKVNGSHLGTDSDLINLLNQAVVASQSSVELIVRRKLQVLDITLKFK